MKRVPTPLPDVWIVESRAFIDPRGWFMEVFHAGKFEALGLPTEFVQDNSSRSVRHTLRGLHYQLREPQGKLVRVVSGSIFDVVVDIRRSSSTFGQWWGATLTAGDGRQIWIPPGFAHGFLALGEVADVAYKCTTNYDASSTRCIAWNDPVLGISWPLPGGTQPILSEQDSAAPGFEEAELFP